MRLNRENYEKELNNPMYIAIGGVVFLLVVVLFCVIVWSVTHSKDDDIVIQNNNVQKEEDTEPEDIVPEVTATPEPEPTPDPESVALQKLIAEKSNDQGVVFTETRDMVTAVGVTNLRSEPSTDKKQETVVTQLNNGDYLLRVGYNEEVGWSKLVYNDTIVYASTNYLVVSEETEE